MSSTMYQDTSRNLKKKHIRN